MRAHFVFSIILVIVMLNLSLAQTPQDAPFSYGLTNEFGSASRFSITPDGSKLALCGFRSFFEGGWVVWDVATGKHISSGVMEGIGARVVAVSTDGKLVAVGGSFDDENGAELKLFDAHSGKALAQLSGHSAPFGGKLAFTKDSKYLISQASDNTIRVWRLSDRAPYAKYCFTSKDDEFNRWKRRPDRPNEKAKIELVHEKLIEEACWFSLSPDDKMLAVPTATNEVLLLDTFTGKLLRSITCQRISVAISAAFSPDGSLLGVGGGIEDGLVELWDLQRNKFVTVFGKHREQAGCLAISPDNQTVVSGGGVDGARVWDVKTGKLKYQIHPKPEEELAILSLAILSDGKTFATLHYREPVHFWDLSSGKAVDVRKQR